MIGKRTGFSRVLTVLARASLVPRHGIIYTGCGVALAMLALCGYSLYQSREDAIDRAREASRDVVVITERDIARNFELYGLSLQSEAEGLLHPGVLNSPRLRREVLFDRAATGQYVGAMFVIDNVGNVVMDSESDVPPKVNFADRTYFTLHRDDPGVGLDVSAPYKSRLRNESPSIALSRRISRPDGSFGGIVAVGINLEYFSSLFAGLTLGRHGSISIIRTDGTVIIRQPDTAHVTGLNMSKTRLFQRIVSQDEGSFCDTSPIDGVRRLYSFKRVSQLPLIVLVAESTGDIYARWTERTLTIGFLMAVFCVGFIVVTAWLNHEFRRRQRVESELALLAGTDGLTSLHNRRALCEILDREWLRARRTGGVLSLLFVDIDHFKAYNDVYGHQAGDQALTAVAHCIKDAIQRPADCVGRYGGEEFIVVLPDTDAVGTMFVGERVRAAVRDLGIAHSGSEFGCVTASIGATTWYPNHATDIGAVIRTADEALYTAKAAGRNKVAQISSV
jgi:diguanylate cyclase (GGDEF)-like protein